MISQNISSFLNGPAKEQIDVNTGERIKPKEEKDWTDLEKL